MKPETVDAYTRLTTLFVRAILAADGELPEGIDEQLLSDPRSACEELNALALQVDGIDDAIDGLLAITYQSMDPVDARRVPSVEDKARIQAAFDRAMRAHAAAVAEAEAARAAEQAARAAAETEAEAVRAAEKAAAEQTAEQAAEEPEPVAETEEQAAAAPEVEPAAEPTAEPEPAASSEPSPEPQPIPASAETMTVDEAASYLGIDRQLVYKRIKSGKIPAQKHGRSWALDAAAVKSLKA